MSFASPAWLFGLLLVPLIWYLHRSGPVLRRHPVSSLLLWKRSEATTSEAGARRHPDPAWIWRAVIATVLSIVLARPQVESGSAPVTIWLDDSLSMRTVEEGRTRTEAGIAEARDLVKQRANAAIVVRKLSRPWQALPLKDSAASGEPGAEPAPPPIELLDPSRSHWLVTDGADAKLNDWTRTAPLERVIRVGDITRNVGITRVAARRQPGATQAIAVEVRVSNGGSERERRTLLLDDGSAAPITQQLTVEPGASQAVVFTLDTVARSLRLQLSPADALEDDDDATLDLASLDRIGVGVGEDCPAGIAKAIAAHPALRPGDESSAQVLLDCGAAGAGRLQVPRIRFADGRLTQVSDDVWLWAADVDAARRISASELPRQMRGDLDPLASEDRVLLSAGDTPLIVRRGGSPRVVDVALDMESAAFRTQQSFPLLISLLVDEALGQQLLGRVAALERGPAASRVASLGKLDARAAAVAPTPAMAPLDLTLLLVLALVALAWDALTLLRRFRRDRDEQWAPPS